MENKQSWAATVFFLVVSGLMASGCSKETVPGSGTYVLLVPQAARTIMGGDVAELVLKKNGDVLFSAKQGRLEKFKGQSRVIFKGDQAAPFRTLNKGIVEGDSVFFWQEFTESGNLILYDNDAASFFKWQQE